MRRIPRALVCGTLLSAFLAPARGQDTVKFIDRATRAETEVVCSIVKESPAGLRIKPRAVNAVERDLLPGDVVSVVYKTKLTADYKQGLGREVQALLPATKDEQRIPLLDQALESFQAILPALKDENPDGHRYLQYKIAQVTAEKARLDPAFRDQAMTLLAAFAQDHAAGWEVIPALRLLAGLQEHKGDAAEAIKTHDRIAALADLPDVLRRENDTLHSGLLVRAGKYSDAETKLQALRKGLEKNDPQLSGVLINLALCHIGQGKLDAVEGELKEAVAANSDPTMRALAHNTLGDFFLLKKQPEEAFWQFLRVDTLYPQDRHEHARALYHLGKLFDEVKKDLVRAEQCKERLKGREFGGTEYQKRLAEEK